MSKKNVYMGIDVGGTAIKIGLFKEEGEKIYTGQIPTRKEKNGIYILDDICKEIHQILEEQKMDKEQLAGVGIGVPGPVTADGEVLGCVNLGWGTFQLEQELANKLGNSIRIKAMNDANAAALGEIWKGGGRGFRNMLFVTLGTGVGGGLVLDGSIIAGSNGAAGEIGHMPVVYNEKSRCSCGKKGCLEQVASATGIVKEAKRILKNKKIPSNLRMISKISARDVMDYAKEGDIVAMQVLMRLGKYMGIAMAHVASIVNPQVIVIGGGVSNAGEILIDIIEKNFKERAFLPCRNVEFKLAELGNEAGMYGAAFSTLERR